MMIPLIQIAIAFFIGLIIVFYAIPIIVRISIEKKLYDVPNERKVNKIVIPNLGGIALFVGISIGTLIGILKNSFPDWRFISATMIILFFIGIKDDILIISARKKFAAQILCALILILLGNIRLTNLHGLFGLNEINYSLSVFISLLTIIGTVNALNLIDGIDGLAASIGTMACIIFGFIFFRTDQINYAVLCAATTGSLVSFFVYNVYGKKNKIFMGDTGSLILGLILCVSAIEYNESTIGQNEVLFRLSPVLSLSILAVPLFDMVRIFSIRILRRKSPFSPDMNHIHHKFLKLGLSHMKCTSIIILSNILIISIVFALKAEDNHTLLFILVILMGTLMLIPEAILKYNRLENPVKKKMQFQSYSIPFKTDAGLRLKTNSNSIVYLEGQTKKEEKEKKVAEK